MPPKSNRKKQLAECLQKGREVKRSKQDDSSQAEGGQEGEGLHGDVLDIDDLMELSQDALNTSRESVDPSFNLDSSVKSDDDFVSESFCENWVLT